MAASGQQEAIVRDARKPRKARKKKHRRYNMHKNNEGYADPTAGKAINGVRREEYQKYLEELHGIKRGKIVTLIHFTGENRQQETLRKYKYRVVELHKHNILLESMSGLKFCPDWPKFHEMLKGATLKPW